jgi:hypothetical protein
MSFGSPAGACRFIIRRMQRSIWKWTLALGVSTAAIVAGCRGDVGKPTDQEVAQMQAWAAVVTPQDREQVTREANQHTDWLERRKVQFITGEYKGRYLHLQSHPSTAKSATTTTSAPPDSLGPTGL